MLTFAAFGGIAPRLDPALLPPNGAQVALNCRLQSGGGVEAYRAPVQVYEPNETGQIVSIYRFGRATASDTEWWFTFLTDTDVCIGQVAGDLLERTFYTGYGFAPRYTQNPIAGIGSPGPYPVNYRTLGVPAPTTAPGVTKSGTPEAGAAPETRFYVYTFVTSDGQESAPSPVSDAIDWSAGETVRLEGIEDFPAGNYDFATGTVRIYRTQAGSADSQFFLVGIASISDLNTADPVMSWVDPEGPIQEELQTEGWTPPPSNLRGLTSLPNGIMAGFTERDVWFTPPYVPYAWPADFVQSVDLPIVGLGAFGNSLAVLTVGEPHVFSGSDPELMAGQKLALRQACVSKRSIQSVGGAVFYASPDGIVSISDAGVAIVTEPHFTKQEWEAFRPESMIGASYDGLYIAFYDDGAGNKGGIILDPRNGAVTTTDLYATAAFGDTVTDTLYLCIDNKIHKFDAGSPLTYQWKSARRSVPRPTSFAWGQVIADSYPVNLTIWRDGEQLMPTIEVASERAFRLPPKVGRWWEVEVSGTNRALAVHLANEASELQRV